MKYSNDFEPGSDEKKRSAKGFYIAMAVCLVAIAGVAVVTFWKDSPKTDTGNMLTTTVTTTSTAKTTVTTTAQPVAVTATGVADDRTTQTTITTTTAANMEELFVFPVSNTIIRDYSTDLVFSETLGEWRTHNGVDFAAESGTPVKATADGTVKSIEEDPLWGHMIQIDHGNKVISCCYGVTAKDVAVGQTVTAGQVIGTVSGIPAEILDESHIHLEIFVNGNYQDPMTLIRGSAVRKTETATTTATK